MNWVTDLINEYQEGRKKLNKTYKSMDKDNPERKIIGSMIRDMTFSIEWLESGRMPGQIKGIDQKRVYQVRSYRKKPIPYGVTGYWDNSVNAIVPKSNYTDPFSEVEDRIDKELEMKNHV